MMTIAEYRRAMHEITRDEFYAQIGNLDVVFSILPGRYPYLISCESRARKVRGLIVTTLSETDGTEVRRYFVPNG